MILFWINVFVNIFDMTTYTVGVRSSFPHEQRKHGRTPDSLIMSTNQNTKRTRQCFTPFTQFSQF